MFKIILPNFNFRIEKWKWNKEYRVYVSTLGNFKDEHKRNLPLKIQTNGYCYVKTFNGVYKACHRLVMLTWKPIPNAESLTVDHLNHNKRENTIYNLEWVTQAENLRRSQEDLLNVPQVDLIKNWIEVNGEKFDNIEQLIDFAISKMNSGCHTKPNRKKIRNRILNAVTNGKSYNKQFYKLVEKRGEE